MPREGSCVHESVSICLGSGSQEESEQIEEKHGHLVKDGECFKCPGYPCKGSGGMSRSRASTNIRLLTSSNFTLPHAFAGQKLLLEAKD